MTPELTALALAGLLQTAQFVLSPSRPTLSLARNNTSTPRDKPPERPLSTMAGRLQRALNNHFEGLILFTLAVVVVTLGNQSTAVTQTAAWVYLGARIPLCPGLPLRPAPLAQRHLGRRLSRNPHNDLGIPAVMPFSV